jgi:hypothetical protein
VLDIGDGVGAGIWRDPRVGRFEGQGLRGALLPVARPDPSGGKLKKTGDPDAGYEWYVTFSDGTEWGWQAKYSRKIDTLLGLMESSLRTVCEKRPTCTRLTFCVPFDLPDGKDPRGRKSAREKFKDRKASWRARIPGAEKVEVRLIQAGEPGR